MTQKARIISLLASGVNPAQVSRAVGVSESYISQLQSTDEGFREGLAEATSKQLERLVELKQGYESLEQGIVGQMQSMLATSDMRELTGALKVVAASNPARHSGNSHNDDGGRSATVVVNLPSHVMQTIDIKTNARNEVIEVDGQSMIPLTPKQVQSKLALLGNKEASNATVEQKTDSVPSERFAEIERIAG